MIPVPVVTDIQLAFPAGLSLLPKWEAIPEAFRKNWINGRADRWFLSGASAEEIGALKPKEGVDKKAALRAIKAVLGSYEPSHEQKCAAVDWFLAEWFEFATPPAESVRPEENPR